MKKIYFRYTLLFSFVFYLLFANLALAINPTITIGYKSVNSFLLKKSYLKSPLSINGIVFPITVNTAILPDIKVNQSSNYNFRYTVTNTKNIAANSYVWVDFDNNGVYTADEAIVTTIPANAVNYPVLLSYPNASFINKLVLGPLKIKFTTTTSTLIDDALTLNVDERSTGLGVDGETEINNIRNILGISISGSVVADGNGLTDGIISGTGIGLVDETPLIDLDPKTPINAYLLDATNLVVAKNELLAGGTYKFDNLYKGSYTVAISLNNYAIGTALASIAPNYPTGWNLAGESFGITGNLPLGIELGTPNMQIAVNPINAPNGVNVDGVNFAVNRTPISSNDKETILFKEVAIANLIDVFNNDNDPDGKPTIEKESILLIDPADLLKKTTVVLPTGTYTVLPSGFVNFTPKDKYLGVADSINYTFKDKAGIESKPATIKLDIAPVGVNDIKVYEKDELPDYYTIKILDNDGTSGSSNLVLVPEKISDSGNAIFNVSPDGKEVTFDFPTLVDTVAATYTFTYRLKTIDGVLSEPITATVIVAFLPAIALTKIGTFNDDGVLVNGILKGKGDGLAQAGETISYSFTVKNTGNVDLVNATVSDPKINLLNAQILPDPLLRGQEGALTIVPNKYVINLNDIREGKVSNTATATAIEPLTKQVVNSTANVEFTFPILKLKLVKTSKIIHKDSNNPITYAGDKIEYTFTVTNTGTVPVKNIGITDLDLGLNINDVKITPSTLAPGAIGILTVSTYTIKQEDIVQGFVTNKATATGTNEQGTFVTAESENNNPANIPNPGCNKCTVTPIIKTPKIRLVKTAIFNDLNNDGFAQVKETITYTFTVTNTGNVDIKNITITDKMLSESNPAVAIVPNVSPVPAVLKPTESFTYTANYPITQVNIDSGKVTNTAIADGFDLANTPVSDVSATSSNVDNDGTVIVLPTKASITLGKNCVVVDVNNNQFTDAGDKIEYTFQVTNTADVTITNISITDGNNNEIGNIDKLLPKETNTSVKVSYIITQNDVNNGSVSFTANAKGKNSKNEDVTATSTSDPAFSCFSPVVITPNPQISLIKKVKNPKGGKGIDGAFLVDDVIEYTFTVKNTGNLTVSNISIADLLQYVTLTGNPIASLIPGASNDVAYTATYKIKLEDAKNGKVSNTATATGSSPGKTDDVTATSTDGSGVAGPTITELAKPPVADNFTVKIKQGTKNTVINFMPYVRGVSSLIDIKSIEPTNLLSANGTIVKNAEGVITYTTPATTPQFIGTFTFNYTVKDQNKLTSNTALVTIKIEPTAPFADDDEAKTEIGKEVKIDFKDNDIQDGSPWDFETVLHTIPANGKVVDNKDGTFTYTPNTNFVGVDEFTYTIKDGNGNITNSAKVTITIEGLFIPNVFTPNGDGINDTFEIVGLVNYTSIEIEVYNRWGNQVYKNSNYQNQWLAEGLNEGTYYYIIQLKTLTNNKIVKGWVLIKR